MTLKTDSNDLSFLYYFLYAFGGDGHFIILRGPDLALIYMY
jgi:hypothetical protein